MVSFPYKCNHCIVRIILLVIIGYTAALDAIVLDNFSPDHKYPSPTPDYDQSQDIPTSDVPPPPQDAASLPPDILKSLASAGQDIQQLNHHIPWSPQDYTTSSNYEKLLYSAENELYVYPDKRNVAKGLKTLKTLSGELSDAIHWLESDDRALRNIVLNTLQEEDPLTNVNSNKHRRRRRRSSILKHLSVLYKQQQALLIASNTCILSDKPDLKAALLPMHQHALSDNTSHIKNNTDTILSQDSNTLFLHHLHLLRHRHHHKMPSLVSSYLANQPGRSKLLKDLIQVGSYNLTDIPGLAAAGDAAFLLASIISSGSGLGLPPSSLLLSASSINNKTSSTINVESVAIKLIHHAAMSGSLEASLSLIDRYRTGRGGLPTDVPGSLERAVTTMTHMASVLDASGGVGAVGGSVLLRNSWMEGGYKTEEGGWLLWDGYDDPHTVNYEREMADRGDAEALRQMGYRQLLGQGLDADGGAAAAAFAAAAAAGDPYALFNDGYMAFQGQHMPRNYTLAKLRFHQAAVLGIHAAYNGLGAVYYHGEGNFTMARYYFEKGVELGDQDSMFNLATMYKDGIIAQLEGSSGRNMTYAVELYNLAESQGHWRSSQELTKIYTYGVPGGDKSSSSSSSIGNIIEKNYTRAFISYDKFTRNIKHWRDGLKDAAMVYLEDGDAWGAGVRYALLAEQGCPEAMLNLGWLMTMEKKEVMGGGGGGGGGDNGPGELFRRAGELGKSQGWLLAGHHMLNNMLGGGSSSGGSHTNASSSSSLAVEYYRRAGNMSNVEALYTLGWLYEQGSHMMSYPHPHHRLHPLERDLDIARQYYREAVDVSVAFRYAVAPWLAMMTLDMRRWGREKWEGLGYGVQKIIMHWDVVVLILLCVILGRVLYLKMKKKKKRIREEAESVAVVHGGPA